MIHLYKNNGYNLCLDVNSGSVHVVDDLSYEVLQGMQDGKDADTITKELSGTYDAGEVSEVIGECELLKKEGMLFTEDPYRDKIDQFAHRPTVVKALCLQIAHDCNLACRYCFAEEGEYHGKRGMMTFEVGRKALDFVVANSGSRRNLEVDFFGGEPTMNWQVVKDLVAYGRSIEEKYNKKFRFTLTTNGVLVNEEIMDFCDREMGNVVMSVDGRAETHNHMRPFRNGKGSYELVIPKFQKWAERRNQDKYYVRGTFTHYNLDFAKDVLALADLGFKQISIEPVVAPPTEDYALREEDLPVIKEQYDILAKEIIKRTKEGRGFNFFHFMVDLTGGPCVYKRLSGCGAGGEYLAVSPWGELFPCHQFDGNRDFVLGTVDEGVTRPDLVEKFKEVNVYSKKECSECFSRFYCSGGCAANSFNFTGGINDVYKIGCELQKKRTECALMIKAALADEEGNTSVRNDIKADEDCGACRGE
uniref:thioether cross-link-forming SCIFF peptide maturase n=1 Tax=Eubacterium cellulosolvens TaxID=29322 RepID=UPI00047F0A1B|nr:thioether cross-link-forming SCIFF peptide maturase [[Eubacterium] cellulosolvens]